MDSLLSYPAANRPQRKLAKIVAIGQSVTTPRSAGTKGVWGRGNGEVVDDQGSLLQAPAV